MSAPIVFPDAAAAAIELLSETITDPIGSRVPNPRPSQFIRLTRDGGPRRNLVVDEASLTLECWSLSEQDAHDLAQTARAALHAAVGSQIGTYGTLYRCDEFAGPAFVPDPVSDQPCYRFTVSFALRGE